jgi:putative beta-lysine N-acetyltransferase
MTDFATSAGHRGRGLGHALLGMLEEEASSRGLRTAYTIARASSVGMNIVFARRGYDFGGLLVNNTGICGAIESMNVWHRRIDGQMQRRV